MESTNSEEYCKVESVIECCKQRGLRGTRLLTATIEILVSSQKPLTISEIVGFEKIGNRFDQTSVYRLITRLEQHGIVRRLGLRERAASYVLQHGHRHDDYIVCTVCGIVEKLEVECPVAPVENAIASSSGYRNLDHALEFFGVCPKCPAA